MAEVTGISWCDATFNSWVGCEKVSPGCAHCYAETLVQGRMGRGGTWGATGTREVTSPGNWKKPLAWAKNARLGLLPDGSENKDGHRPRIFCASLADVFEERPEVDEARYALFDLIRATPELDWLVLTKRPEFALRWLRGYAKLDPGDDTFISREGIWWGCLRNLWMGVSIENARHTYRADVLREIPAAVRFISAEPLLGSLYDGTLSDRHEREFLAAGRGPEQRAREHPAVRRAMDNATRDSLNEPHRKKRLDLNGIDWVIGGGESGGRGSRPMQPDWAREIRDACLSEDYIGPGEVDRVGPAFHFKQWGSWSPFLMEGNVNVSDIAIDSDGSIRSASVALPGPDTAWMRYRGSSPKSGGTILDGREWAEFPESNVLVSA